jgi:glyoxylase-like metal-dependent hydrolase (beta-lactamase superfamily II)
VLAPILLPAFNPGPMTGDGNNTYLLVDERGSATLIDAGVGDPRHVEAIARALGEHNARLDEVIVTHAHGDHAKGAASLAQAHPGARFSKYPWPAEDARYAVVWHPLAAGDRVGRGRSQLTTIFTPGHSPDHLAFWHEPSRTAFTGDLVVANTTVMIAASKGGDLADYLASLERVRALGPTRLLPAHGPEIPDVDATLTRYAEHRQRREKQVFDELARGLDNVQAITESIYHGVSPSLMPAAAENVRAHLDKLKKEGRATYELERWRIT